MVHVGRHAGRWGAYAAAGLALALVSGSVLGDPKPEHDGGKPAAAQRDGKPQPDPAAALHGDAQRIAAALEGHNKYEQSAQGQKDTHEAAQAAQKGAFWAKLMFFAAFAETIVTAVGVYLVYRTLSAASRSATAAEKTLAHARTATQQELRAYISIEPRGIQQRIGHTDAIGQVELINVGKIPARKVSLTVKAAIYERSKETLGFDSIDTEPVERTVQPGASLRQGSRIYLGISEIIQQPELHIFVWGVAFYDDGFGTGRFTSFCHRYSCASYNRTIDGKNPYWDQKARSSQSLIDADKARYHTTGNDAD